MRASKSLLNREAVIPKSFCFSPLLSPLPCLCLYALACCVPFFRGLLTIALPSIITHPSSDSFPIGTLPWYRPTQSLFFLPYSKNASHHVFSKKKIPLKFITITAGEGKSAVGYVSPDRIRKQIDVLNRAYSQANIGFTLTDNIQVREENTLPDKA